MGFYAGNTTKHFVTANVHVQLLLYSILSLKRYSIKLSDLSKLILTGLFLIIHENIEPIKPN